MLGIYEILCSIVFNYLDFYDKYTFKRTRKFMNKIHITDLFDIEDKYLENIDDDILLNHRFAIRLYICDRKISRVNHMTKLKELDASYDCGIGDNNIKDINLEKLNANHNQNISDVNHMTNLKELNACSENYKYKPYD